MNSFVYVACVCDFIRERSASDAEPGFGEHVMHQFYHVKNASQVCFLRLCGYPLLFVLFFLIRHAFSFQR